MIKTQISLVETTLTKIPRISLGYNGKFEAHCTVRRWRGMAYLGVVARNLNTARPLAKSEIMNNQPGNNKC